MRPRNYKERALAPDTVASYRSVMAVGMWMTPDNIAPAINRSAYSVYFNLMRMAAKGLVEHRSFNGTSKVNEFRMLDVLEPLYPIPPGMDMRPLDAALGGLSTYTI